MWRTETRFQSFGGDTRGKEITWKAQAYKKRIILKLISKKLYWGRDWIDLAEEKEMWQAVLNAVTNFRFP